jgi:hypothetical protein
MSSMKLNSTRDVPLRVILKTSVLAGLVVVVPLYSFLAWAEFGYPARTGLKGLSLFLLVALSGGFLWWIFRRKRSCGGGPGRGPDGPKTREPRPPGGRPPALSAAARANKDQE